MNSRGVRMALGKRITKIHQMRMVSNAGPYWDVLSIELEDGTRLVPFTVVLPEAAEYEHDMLVQPPQRKRKAAP